MDKYEWYSQFIGPSYASLFPNDDPKKQKSDQLTLDGKDWSDKK